MKSMKKLLFIVILALIVAVGVGSCAAGLFDFGSGDSNSTNSNVSGEINLAAAASLKNAFDKDLIPMTEVVACGEEIEPFKDLNSKN